MSVLVHRFVIAAAVIVLVTLCGVPLSAQFCPGAPCIDIFSPDEAYPQRLEEMFSVYTALHTPDARAWSYGVCHDPTELELLDVVPAYGIEYLDSLGIVDFFDVQFSPSVGVAVQIVLCPAPCPAPPYDLFNSPVEIRYHGLEIGIATIEICDTVQFPPDPPVTSSYSDGVASYPLGASPFEIEIIDFFPLFPPNPAYDLDFAPIADGVPGSVRSASSRLTAEPGSSGIQGWSFGICHDPSVLSVVGAEPGADLSTLRLGTMVDFFAVNWEAEEGVMTGVVVCQTACATVPAGPTHEVLRSEYELVGAAGTIATLEYCNQVTVTGAPTVQTLVVVDNQSVGPTLGTGTIAIASPGGVPLVEPGFLRGDANASGNVNIADAISLAMHLFQGAPAPACGDAADANDDGEVDLADVIGIATALFGGGAPIAPPYPACGADASPDALACTTMCP